MKLTVYDNAEQACISVAFKLAKLAEMGGSVALSGGSTPKLLFKIMAEKFRKADWNKLYFFWGDERLVPAESRQSNYGEFYRELIKPGIITGERVFPTDYIQDSTIALENIENKIKRYIPYHSGFPRFDLIILGIGEDGHIASIFPNNLKSFESKKVVELAYHPVNQQERITLTGSTINNALEIIFLCTGDGKKEIIYDIIENNNSNLPATHVAPQREIEWCIDKLAAQNLIHV